MAAKTKYKDLLDYTISYKAVWTVIGIIFAFGVAAAIAYARLKPASEDEKARQVVKAAERLLQRADGCTQTDLKPEDQAMLAEGTAALQAAHDALTRRAFPQAGALAHDAQNALKQFVEHVCATRDAVADFTNIQGDVKVKKVQSPRWVPARKGSLAVGDRIHCIDGAASIIYRISDERQDIRPGSIIEIKEVFRRDGKEGTLTSLEIGEVRMRSSPDSISTIIEPHGATVEPKGAEVEVNVPEDGRRPTRFTGITPGATVTHRNGTVTLDRLHSVEAGSDGTLTKPVKSLESPELKEPIDGRVFSSEKPEPRPARVGKFHWGRSS